MGLGFGELRSVLNTRNLAQPSTQDSTPAIEVIQAIDLDQGLDEFGERTFETDFNPGLSVWMNTGLHDYREAPFQTGLLPETNDLLNRPYGHLGRRAALRSRLNSLNNRSRRQESRMHERRTHDVIPTQWPSVRATDINAATGRFTSSPHSRAQLDERVESQALNARVQQGTQFMRTAVEAQALGATLSRGTQVMSAELDDFAASVQAMDVRTGQRNQVRSHPCRSTQVMSRRPHQCQASEERIIQGTQVLSEALAQRGVPDDLAGEPPAPVAISIRHGDGTPSQGIPSHDWDAEGQALEAGVSHGALSLIAAPNDPDEEGRASEARVGHERQAVSVSPHNSDEESPALEAREHWR